MTRSRLSNAPLLLVVIMCFVFSVFAAKAQTKLTLLYSPISDVLGSFIAKDEGYFARHGLDVDLSLAPNPGTVVPAIFAGTVEIAETTPGPLFQATEQGLDIIVIAGTIRWIPTATQISGIVVRTDSGIHDAADLPGKRVAVPSLGQTIDLLARKWIETQNVDFRRINWVEMPFPQMGDALKSSLVDAVALVYPFYDRLIDAKVGRSIANYNSVMPPGTMPTVYVTSRAWAAKHTAIVSAFRAALDEARGFYDDPSHQPLALASLAKWTKLPPQIVSPAMLPARLDVHVDANQLIFWVPLLREQGWIKGNPDPTSLIAP